MGTDRAPRDFDRALGERLRGIRESRHLSLQNVEDMSGGKIRLAALRSWETGERRCSTSRLTEVAAFYELPMTYFLGLAEPDPDVFPGIDEYPAEMSLSRDRWGRYVLVIDAPEFQGTAVTSSREIIQAITGACAAFRRDQDAVSAA